MSRCKVSVVLLSSSKSSLSLSRERKEEEEDKEDKDKERKAVLFFVVVAGALFVLSALLFCLVCRRKALISLSAWCRSLVEIERKDTHITRIKTRL